MDISPQMKQELMELTELQLSWVPKEGDFWSCSCDSCLNYTHWWIIDQSDVISIMPKKERDQRLDHCMRELKDWVILSDDCGFGQFWRQWKWGETTDENRGFLWIPRLDQLLEYIQKRYYSEEPFHRILWQYYSFVKYYCYTQKEHDISPELFAVKWIKLIEKSEKELKKMLDNEKAV